MWSWNTVTVGEPAVGLLISFIFHIHIPIIIIYNNNNNYYYN